MSSLPPTCPDCGARQRDVVIGDQEQRQSGSALALCFARYLSLYFSPKGLQLGASLEQSGPHRHSPGGKIQQRTSVASCSKKALGHLPVRPST